MFSWINTSNVEVQIALYAISFSFLFMWYQGKLPSTGQIQDFATIMNSRGGNIIILMIASVYFFHRAEVMYYNVVEMIRANTIASDNGIALNGLTFDTGAFGSAFGALLKTMSPDAPSPANSATTGTTSTTTTLTKPPTPSTEVPRKTEITETPIVPQQVEASQVPLNETPIQTT